jgi:S1-C subfamily serine protease
MRRTPALLLAALLVLSAACSSDDSAGGDGSAAGGSANGCPSGALDAKQLLRCIGPAIAYVGTPSSTGSGVLIDGGYVVTNAHVVDPFPSVDLTFPDRSRRSEVPVAGIDAFADIALLGPIADADQIEATPIDLGSGAATEKGEDVFLLGYPGEGEEEPDPTISRGVLSRTRQVREFEQTYLQTDASIGGGQSGGALVDGHGQLLGISGLSFAEEFALALDGADVQEAVARIRDGKGDEYGSIPDLSGATGRHRIELADPLQRESLVIGAADRARTIDVAIGDGQPDVGLVALSLYGDTLLLNQPAADAIQAIGDLTPSDLGVTVSAPEPGGRYRFDLEAGIEAVVIVSTTDPAGAEIDIETSAPSVVAPHTAPGALELGATESGVFGFFENADEYTLDLQAGDRVHVSASSPQGDTAVLILPPGGGLAQLEVIDDGGGGLYEYDSEGDYTAPVDGTYRFGVLTFDGVVTGYRFSVDAA